ncbi:MAG: alpha/beta hydrolase [Solirubrobacterales bacterium]|nr:alpha/beta hydrolase [Solirubrobacterales bacterium]
MDSSRGSEMVRMLLTVVVRALLDMPDRLMRLLFGNPPAEAAGLRPDQWALSRATAPIENGSPARTPEEGRRRTEFLASVVGRPVSGVISQDWTLEGDGRSLEARLFTPEASPLAGPMLLHFHGGGWVQGSVDSHRHACARLAKNARVRVLSVEYRLAPEHPLPAQSEDALLAWRSVTADPARFGADPSRVGVIGDSAGAHIAAVLCLDLKGAGEAQPACQVLVYPVTDCAGTMESRRIFARGFYLTQARMDWFEQQAVPPGEERNPRISPLYAEDLTGLAPALVSVSIADPLRDEGIAYGERLAAAGVPVTIDRMPMLHAWFNMTATRSSRSGHEVLAGRVNELLG